LLSGLWIKEKNIKIAENDVQALRQEHGYTDSEGKHIDFLGEFKWTKVSKRYLHVYKDLIDLLFDWIEKDLVRFNTMLIDTHDPTVSGYSNIKDEGYFKFLYQLYFHNSKIPGIYKIFPDRITNPIQANVNFGVLLRCLNAAFKKKFVPLLNPADIPERGEFVEGIIPVDSKKVFKK